MTLLRPCHGYEIKSEEENQFATASKCTKEVCITSGLPYNILRHKQCLHFSLVKSKIPICKKCEIFIRSKKYKSKKSNNKENERIECSPQQIMEKIKVLVPNLENNQLTLIESHITASCVNKNRMRWDKDIICMALSLFNRNPAPIGI